MRQGGRREVRADGVFSAATPSGHENGHATPGGDNAHPLGTRSFECIYPNEGHAVTEQSPYPYQTQLAPAPAPRNGLGTAGFVLGLIGLIFSPIPLIGVVAWPLVILGLIFVLLGFSHVRGDGRRQ